MHCATELQNQSANTQQLISLLLLFRKRFFHLKYTCSLGYARLLLCLRLFLDILTFVFYIYYICKHIYLLPFLLIQQNAFIVKQKKRVKLRIHLELNHQETTKIYLTKWKKYKCIWSNEINSRKKYLKKLKVKS